VTAPLLRLLNLIVQTVAEQQIIRDSWSTHQKFRFRAFRHSLSGLFWHEDNDSKNDQKKRIARLLRKKIFAEFEAMHADLTYSIIHSTRIKQSATGFCHQRGLLGPFLRGHFVAKTILNPVTTLYTSTVGVHVGCNAVTGGVSRHFLLRNWLDKEINIATWALHAKSGTRNAIDNSQR
jgi:hypothetical protein